MTSTNQWQTTVGSSSQKTAPTNPFARALAETEQSAAQNSPQYGEVNPFGDALAQTGGNFDFNQFNQNNPTDIFAHQEQQQADLERQRKREAMRRKLHDQVNPTNTTELFSLREKKVKEEIDKIRHDLRMLVKDVAKFHRQVEITLMTEIANPGWDGKYYLTFFQNLRSLILLMRQRIKSAQTWATQLNAKSKKKKQRQGMMIGGQAHEKTSTVQDMMHHERSTAYSGG